MARARYVKDEWARSSSPGVKGRPMRRGNFNKMSGWPPAVASISITGLRISTTFAIPGIPSLPLAVRGSRT